MTKKRLPLGLLRSSVLCLLIACTSPPVFADVILMGLLLADLHDTMHERKHERKLDLAERAPVIAKFDDKSAEKLSAAQFSDIIHTHKKWYVVLATDTRKLGRLLIRSEDQSVMLRINTPRYGARLKKESVITVGHTGKDKTVEFFYKDVPLHFKQHNIL